MFHKLCALGWVLTIISNKILKDRNHLSLQLHAHPLIYFLVLNLYEKFLFNDNILPLSLSVENTFQLYLHPIRLLSLYNLFKRKFITSNNIKQIASFNQFKYQIYLGITSQYFFKFDNISMLNHFHHCDVEKQEC